MLIKHVALYVLVWGDVAPIGSMHPKAVRRRRMGDYHWSAQ